MMRWYEAVMIGLALGFGLSVYYKKENDEKIRKWEEREGSKPSTTDPETESDDDSTPVAKRSEFVPPQAMIPVSRFAFH